MKKRRKKNNIEDYFSPKKNIIKSTEEFREKILSLLPDKVLRKHIASPEEFWNHSKSKSEKIEAIQFIVKKAKRTKEHPLFKCLQQIEKDTLSEIYSSYFKPRNVSKISLIWEIIDKFLSDNSGIEKREIEFSNLRGTKGGELQKEFEYIEIEGIILPHEICGVILSYLSRDYDTITRIGGVCKLFYILLLKTKKNITIEQSNIFSVSLLSLKHVNSLAIKNIGKEEQKYLWNKINPQKIRKLEVFGSSVNIMSCLKNLGQLANKQKEKFRLRNIECFTIRGELNSFDLLKYSLEDIFPNLKTLRYSAFYRGYTMDPMRNCCENLRIIKFHHNYPKYAIRDFFGALERCKFDGSKINELSISAIDTISFCSTKSLEKFRKILGICGNIQVLTLDFFSSVTKNPQNNGNRTSFDIWELLQIQKLRKLHIYEHSECSEILEDINDQIDYSINLIYPEPSEKEKSTSTKKIDEISFFSAVSEEQYFSGFDFNLSDLLTRGIEILSNKKFRCELFIFPRKFLDLDSTLAPEPSKRFMLLENFRKFLVSGKLNNFEYFFVRLRDRKFCSENQNIVEALEIIFERLLIVGPAGGNNAIRRLFIRFTEFQERIDSKCGVYYCSPVFGDIRVRDSELFSDEEIRKFRIPKNRNFCCYMLEVLVSFYLEGFLRVSGVDVVVFELIFLDEGISNNNNEEVWVNYITKKMEDNEWINNIYKKEKGCLVFSKFL